MYAWEQFSVTNDWTGVLAEGENLYFHATNLNSYFFVYMRIYEQFIRPYKFENFKVKMCLTIYVEHLNSLSGYLLCINRILKKRKYGANKYFS